MILPICRIQLTTGKLGERQTGKLGSGRTANSYFCRKTAGWAGASGLGLAAAPPARDGAAILSAAFLAAFSAARALNVVAMFLAAVVGG
jgi:hypothetical protein